MPLVKFDLNNGNPWAIWKIDGGEKLPLSTERLPKDLSHPRKQQEWTAGRSLVRLILGKIGVAYEGITKDSHGKPFPVGSGYQLSLSHSYPYVAAFLNTTASAGIDLEQPRQKLLNVAQRVFSKEELALAANNPTQLCILWCAKEALVKIHGKKDLSFIENLAIGPFSLEKAGYLVGSIIVNDSHQTVPLYYEVHEEFVVVLNL